MERMGRFLTIIQKNRKRDRGILKCIASQMVKDKKFDSEDDGEDEELTP